MFFLKHGIVYIYNAMFNNNSKRYLITKMRLKGKKIWNVNKKSIEKFKKKQH